MNDYDSDNDNDNASVIVETGDGRLDHLRGLMPMIRSAVNRSGGTLRDVRMIAVSAGPGSFTGIRIGVAAARTLAQVLGVSVVPVNTLFAMACNAFGPAEDGTRIVPMIDARRGQVYAAVYEPGNPEARIREDAYDTAAFLKEVRAYAMEKTPERLIFCGDGAEINRELILSVFPEAAEQMPEASERDDAGSGDININISSNMIVDLAEGPDFAQNAEGVLRAGRRILADGGAVSYEDVKAVYLRKAEAERKRESGRLGRKKKADPGPILEMPPEDGAIHYRMLDAEDLDALTALDKLCFAKAWSRADFEGDLAGSRKAVYAGAFNSRGELTGFAGIVYLLDEGDVNRVAVHPLYRAGGIGGHCLRMAMEAAERDSMKKLLLEVKEGNRSAISLYKDCGFRVISKRKGYYSDTGENALIMQRGEQEGE